MNSIVDRVGCPAEADVELVQPETTTEQLETMLSPEQRYCVELVRQGCNIFFTGCAGTGKSFLLRYLTRILPKESTFVTALTGVAAVNIGGSTLHSFAGIQLGNKPLDVMLKMVTKGKVCF